MDVGVDQAGDEVAARGVDPLAALVAPDARDPAAGDRDVPLEPLAREDGEHAGAGDDEVRLGVAAGDREELGAAHAASLASVPASTCTPRARSAGAVYSSG